METINNNLKEFIDNYIRERVQADGGEISYQSFKDNKLTVKVQGECSRCQLTDNCLNQWIIDKIYEKFNITISIDIVKNKPYFWDK